MFIPYQKSEIISFKTLVDNYKFHIMKDERLVLKMEGKTNFLRSLKV